MSKLKLGRGFFLSATSVLTSPSATKTSQTVFHWAVFLLAKVAFPNRNPGTPFSERKPSVLKWKVT